MNVYNFEWDQATNKVTKLAFDIATKSNDQKYGVVPDVIYGGSRVWAKDELDAWRVVQKWIEAGAPQHIKGWFWHPVHGLGDIYTLGEKLGVKGFVAKGAS